MRRPGAILLLAGLAALAGPPGMAREPAPVTASGCSQEALEAAQTEMQVKAGAPAEIDEETVLAAPLRRAVATGYRALAERCPEKAPSLLFQAFLVLDRAEVPAAERIAAAEAGRGGLRGAARRPGLGLAGHRGGGAVAGRKPAGSGQGARPPRRKPPGFRGSFCRRRRASRAAPGRPGAGKPKPCCRSSKRACGFRLGEIEPARAQLDAAYALVAAAGSAPRAGPLTRRYAAARGEY